ncbi:DUF4132 domain-containing protein [Glycomyces artemisiae]|uniref:Uncharacterized protein DUF4132 n=1 Tax=Glycomyces artemisiae TaxID=1076443 RepID=A0A2T0UKN5_9ACTN|nr:DUF4132 domain-containing protein [Glycomyces artemisiae]PRY58501.1 uncharacterized protein DUF4132 [Glycomyces artemisiae]
MTSEDRLEIPAAWLADLPPRRGVRTGEPPVLDADASKRVRGRIGSSDADLRYTLAQPYNTEFAAAGLRHLDGDPDPEGAAVLSTLLAMEVKRDSTLRPELDAWVQDHGLAFATAACAHSLVLHAWNASGRWNKPHTVRERQVRRKNIHELGILRWEYARSFRVLRGLLAAADDAEYDAAAAALDLTRTDPVARFVATIVMPEQADWAEEVCREHKGTGDAVAHMLLCMSVDRLDLLTAAGVSRLEPWAFNRDVAAALLDNLGTDALPVLAATSRQQIDAADRRLILDAISRLPSDEAMDHLIGRLDESYVFEAATAAAARFPRRVLRAVAAAARIGAPELRPRLAALADDATNAARDALEGDDAAVIADLLAPSPIPDADPADLPPLLTAPPWTVKRAKRKPAVIAGLESREEPRFVWAEGQRDLWSKPGYDYFRGYTDKDWAKFVKRGLGRGGARVHYSSVLTYAPMSFALQALEHWDGAFAPYSTGDLKVIAARFGPLAADGLATALRANPTYHEALVPMRTVEGARIAADWFARLKGARASAVAWFERHGAAGAALLVPDALGADKKLRGNAEGALWYLAVLCGADAVAEAAEPYGPEAAQAIRELLDGDPLEPRGVKVPKPGAWAAPRLLPQVLTAAGDRALPGESVRHLITVLALSTPEYPYAGLDVAAAACDRASLTRFSRGLFRLWLSSGAPSKDGWALTQLAHFADDDTVRLLAPLVREWPGQAQHKRAVNGLGVLGAIGSEEALRAIQGIAEKVKFKALKEEARVQIAAIAEGLGLTREQLADRLLPDFGLGDAGALVLDYGPRRFTVVFDEQLKPFVTDDSGKPRKSLPKPGAKDDAEKADAAYKRFALLKKELRTVAADQVQRLEAAMINGRTWTRDEFERYYVNHPLTWHLARRLVWSAEADGASTAFRVAEDRSYTDVEDDAFDLPDGAVIRLDHPVRMGERAADWAGIFADYEILQPFEQLSRPVLAFTEEELATGRLTRFEGAKVEVGKLLGLTSKGWQRAAPEDGGVEPGIHFPLPAGGFITVALDPGIWVGMIAENPVQTLSGVRIMATENYWWSATAKDPDPDHPTDIDPVTASEVLAALTRVTAKD